MKFKSLTKIISLACAATFLSFSAYADDISESTFKDRSGDVVISRNGDELNNAPNKVAFRTNGDAELADFTKDSDGRKMSMLWKIEDGKFCMVPVTAVGAEYKCYDAQSTGANQITLTLKEDGRVEEIVMTLK